MSLDLRLVQKDNIDEEFRIPATDTKGHSSRHWFRSIPAMAHMVEQIVQSRKFPYSTKGALLRHALHRHVSWLNSIESVCSVSGQVDAILEILRDEEMNNDFDLVFNKMDERISGYLASGESKEAARLISKVQGHVNSMPDGFWKNKYRDKIRKKYGYVLSTIEKAKFGEMEDE